MGMSEARERERSLGEAAAGAALRVRRVRAVGWGTLGRCVIWASLLKAGSDNFHGLDHPTGRFKRLRRGLTHGGLHGMKEFSRD